MNLVLMRGSHYNAKRRAFLKHIVKLKEKTYGVNNRLQHIRVSNRKLNCLRWHNNEGREHIIKKLDICIRLKRMGHVFITEAIFNNNSRADVVDLTDGVIYEVLCNEEEEDCNEKIRKYPKEFKIIKVNC